MTNSNIIKKAISHYQQRSLNQMESNRQELQMLNTRVRLAQKEALQRFYSSVQQEVMDTKKVAEEAKHLNDTFDRRTREERAERLNNAKAT